jgi:hypothetical protein
MPLPGLPGLAAPGGNRAATAAGAPGTPPGNGSSPPGAPAAANPAPNARRPAPNAQAPASNRSTPAPSGPALTSFVITCRVNAKHPDLIAASAVLPTPAKSANASLSGANKTASGRQAGKQAQADTGGVESDSGEENAD